MIKIMKVTILEKQKKIEGNPLKHKEYDRLEIKSGQVGAKVQANGVCHSDLPICRKSLSI